MVSDDRRNTDKQAERQCENSPETALHREHLHNRLAISVTLIKPPFITPAKAFGEEIGVRPRSDPDYFLLHTRVSRARFTSMKLIFTSAVRVTFGLVFLICPQVFAQSTVGVE